jgi:outer membrane protein assembly factor BamB
MSNRVWQSIARLWRASFVTCALASCFLRAGVAPAAPDAFPAALVAAGHWPSFRGPYASGVADGQDLPDRWEAEAGAHIVWKQEIPGLAHSSPIVWSNRVFLTTAVSSQSDATFRPGLYGDGTASEDRSVHRWLVLCLDRDTGAVRWTQTATDGVPVDKRHVKGTYANATPATDGRFVVACFGSQGLFGFDLEGRLLWKKDLGRLNAGAYDAPGYEWGTASSPVIHRDTVIVQCDTQGESFVLAADLKTGRTVWRTGRDELPSWGTPTVYPGAHRTELVANGSNFIRGYDVDTGAELWRLGGSSKITAPTPTFAGELILVASGRAPERPIFAIRAGATGDLTLEQGQSTNRFVAWSKVRKGPYMPSPLTYRNLVYVLNNNGLLDTYDLPTGEEVYGQHLPHRGSGFSASPVAADGRVFCSSEDGDVLVVKAGREFEVASTNRMGEPLMATPAVARGRLFIRGLHHLFAIGR